MAAMSFIVVTKALDAQPRATQWRAPAPHRHQDQLLDAAASSNPHTEVHSPYLVTPLCTDRCPGHLSALTA